MNKRLIMNNEERKSLNRPANGNYCIQTLITPQSARWNQALRVCSKGKWWTRRFMSRPLRHCFVYEVHHCDAVYKQTLLLFSPQAPEHQIANLAWHGDNWITIRKAQKLRTFLGECDLSCSEVLIIVCFYDPTSTVCRADGFCSRNTK